MLARKGIFAKPSMAHRAAFCRTSGAAADTCRMASIM